MNKIDRLLQGLGFDIKNIEPPMSHAKKQILLVELRSGKVGVNASTLRKNFLNGQESTEEVIEHGRDINGPYQVIATTCGSRTTLRIEKTGD